MPTPKLWHLVILLAGAALPTAAGLHAALEHDTWWHLAVGRFIVETHAVPQTDPFSRLSRENPVPWLAYSWLYEVALFEVHRAAGIAGLLILRTSLVLFSTGTMLAYLFRRGGFTPLSMTFAVLTLTIMMMLATERPWHITIAFTTLTLWAVQCLREGQPLRRALWLLPLFALWANLHIQFVLGWGVLGLACLFPNKANRAGLIALTFGCVLATAVNPYHVRLLEVIRDYAVQSSSVGFVDELAPPQWNAPSTLATSLLLLLTAGILAARRRPVDLFELALLLVAAAFAARMRRDIWFAALAAIATLQTATPPSVAQIWKVIGCIAILMFGLRGAELFIDSREDSLESKQQNRYPHQAVKFLRQSHLPGPVFNEFDWGGYLIWHLPNEPVSIDGRTNLYGCERLLRSRFAWTTRDGWKHDPDFATANIVVAPRDRALTEVLLEKPHEWAVLTDDPASIIFVRRRIND